MVVVGVVVFFGILVFWLVVVLVGRVVHWVCFVVVSLFCWGLVYIRLLLVWIRLAL